MRRPFYYTTLCVCQFEPPCIVCSSICKIICLHSRLPLLLGVCSELKLTQTDMCSNFLIRNMEPNWSGFIFLPAFAAPLLFSPSCFNLVLILLSTLYILLYFFFYIKCRHLVFINVLEERGDGPEIKQNSRFDCFNKTHFQNLNWVKIYNQLCYKCFLLNGQKRIFLSHV